MAERIVEEFTIVEEEMIVDECPGRQQRTATFDHAVLLPRILRALGAIMISACASIFLFQKWDMGNDIQRYLLLLGFTTLLTAGGFFCGLKLKESKGARTLLGLTIAVAPVNFTVLGGLFYSQFPLGATPFDIPKYMSWVAPSPTAALIITIAGSLLLSGLCYISFLTLGRIRARLLTLCFVLSNLALLIPLRQPDPVGVMLVAVVVGLLVCEARYFRGEPTLRTLEGRFSRLALWVAPVLLAARTGYLYSSSSVLQACVLAAVALLGFMLLPTLTRQLHVQKLLQGLSMVPATLAWVTIAGLIFSEQRLGYDAVLPLCTLPTALLLAIVSFYAIGGGRGYRRAAALVAMGGAAANLLLFPGLSASFSCLLTAVVILIYGFFVEQKVIFVSGVVGVVVGLGYHLKYALDFYSLFNWGSLAVTGVAIIITASLLERHHLGIAEKIESFRGRFQSWSH